MLLKEPAVPSLLLSALVLSALCCGSEACLHSRDGVNLLNIIKDKEPSWEQDSQTRLYTPTQDHYQRCPASTLRCMRSEMEMLLDEWTITDKKTRKILSILKAHVLDIQHRSPRQESGCVHCEHFPEKPAQTFLKVLNFTLQQINAACPMTS